MYMYLIYVHVQYVPEPYEHISTSAQAPLLPDSDPESYEGYPILGRNMYRPSARYGPGSGILSTVYDKHRHPSARRASAASALAASSPANRTLGIC